MTETGGLRLKIFIIALEDAGKSSLIDRIVNFEYESISTTSHSITTSDYSTINYDKRKQIKCDLCTSNALRNFKSMLNESNNSDDVCIALIGVYDITNKHSWTHLKKLAHDLKDELKHINFLILGNKFDLLEKRQVSKTEVENYAVKHGFLFSEVSIKNGFNVREAFDNLVDRTFIRFKHRKLASGLFSVPREVLEKQVTCVNSTLPKLSNSLNVETSRSTASTSNNMIDVNSNSLLLSFSAYNRNGELETKKLINEVFSIFDVFFSIQQRFTT
jgi:GTPase SAR1 family protein